MVFTPVSCVIEIDTNLHPLDSLPDIRSASTVSITYIEADGTERTVDAEIGQNMLQVAHDNDIELEGACIYNVARMRVCGE